MLAFQISVNGQQRCVVSSEQVVSVISTIKGEQTVGGAEPPSLDVSGMTRPLNYAIWLRESLTLGDTVTIELVEVSPSAVAAPIEVRGDMPEQVERERRAYYERLKAEYEPMPTEGV
ncbi:MAG: hypothetical protein AAF528_00380 [Cyanobacteria bacterium P01_C01_bin.121]